MLNSKIIKLLTNGEYDSLRQKISQLKENWNTISISHLVKFELIVRSGIYKSIRQEIERLLNNKQKPNYPIWVKLYCYYILSEISFYEGRYGDAIAHGEKGIQVLQLFTDETKHDSWITKLLIWLRGKIIYRIGTSYLSISYSLNIQDLMKKELRFQKKHGSNYVVGLLYNALGLSFTYKKLAQAEFYFRNSNNVLSKQHDLKARIGVASNLALIQYWRGNMKDSIKTLLNIEDLISKNHVIFYRELFFVYINLSNVFVELGDIIHADLFYSLAKGVSYYIESPLENSKLDQLNGDIHFIQGKYEEAKKAYFIALQKRERYKHSDLIESVHAIALMNWFLGENNKIKGLIKKYLPLVNKNRLTPDYKARVLLINYYYYLSNPESHLTKEIKNIIHELQDLRATEQVNIRLQSIIDFFLFRYKLFQIAYYSIPPSNFNEIRDLLLIIRKFLDIGLENNSHLYFLKGIISDAQFELVFGDLNHAKRLALKAKRIAEKYNIKIYSSIIEEILTMKREIWKKQPFDTLNQLIIDNLQIESSIEEMYSSIEEQDNIIMKNRLLGFIIVDMNGLSVFSHDFIARKLLMKDHEFVREEEQLLLGNLFAGIEVITSLRLEREEIKVIPLVGFSIYHEVFEGEWNFWFIIKGKIDSDLERVIKEMIKEIENNSILKKILLEKEPYLSISVEEGNYMHETFQSLINAYDGENRDR